MVEIVVKNKYGTDCPFYYESREICLTNLPTTERYNDSSSNPYVCCGINNKACPLRKYGSIKVLLINNK